MVAQLDMVANASLLKQIRIMQAMERPVPTKKKSGPNPSSAERNLRGDKLLGIDRGITRRDFLNATLLASGGMLLNPVSPSELLAANPSPDSNQDDFTGYGGIGDYANSNGNTLPVLEAGHQIRDGQFENLPATCHRHSRDL